MAPKTPKPLDKSKTVGHAHRPQNGLDRRNSWRLSAHLDPGGHRPQQPGHGLPAGPGTDADPAASRVRLASLASEWILDLRVLGRSPRTIGWYQQKIDAFITATGAVSLADLTAFELKRYVLGLQDRGLAPNTVHGCFQVVKGLASWAHAQGYAVDPALLRVRAPRLPQVEMETYTPAQLDAVISAARPTWVQLAVLILLGTGMRVSELCALTVEDFEDDGDHSFLKVRRGKGAKFRRVPVSHRLRREILRYLNHVRPAASRSENLLIVSGGQPVKVETCSRQLNRAGHTAGFRVHAHKFRHTFATTYLRNSGDIERLRKILGHTTYAMVMRYVHLDASDLDVDFDDRSPF
jgi:integrase